MTLLPAAAIRVTEFRRNVIVGGIFTKDLSVAYRTPIPRGSMTGCDQSLEAIQVVHVATLSVAIQKERFILGFKFVLANRAFGIELPSREQFFPDAVLDASEQARNFVLEEREHA